MKADEKKPAEFFTPQHREKKPVKLTVDQYLKQANFGGGIVGLIRSMYGTKIMAPTEWEAAIEILLNRQVR